jgi:GNAT superfamily N-acetyltransferase
MIEILETKDLKSAANFTLANMKPYYDKYKVDWSLDDIYEATKELSNFDLRLDGQCIGVLRISFENGHCQLRDIQIDAEYQGKGYGAAAIANLIAIARMREARVIELKVFQCSPAHRLYRRVGFIIESEDDRFYYMSLPINDAQPI